MTATGSGAPRTHRSRIRLLALAAAAVGLTLPAAAGAAQFTVTSAQDLPDSDTGDGVCAAVNGGCTLRAALDQANALSGAHTIAVPAGTYRPVAPLPAVTKPITIQGPAGARATVVEGPRRRRSSPSRAAASPSAVSRSPAVRAGSRSRRPGRSPSTRSR